MSSPLVAIAPSPDTPKAVILVVEDHPATQKCLKLLLSDALGADRVEIRTADTGEAAIAAIGDSLPDVVVMDITLPGMNGIEAARIIRERAPAIKVVMHTNNDAAVYRDMCATVGIGTFVSKQRTWQDLVPAIARMLEPAG